MNRESNASILVVEDDGALSTLLRYNLEAAGYRVETIADGDEADRRLYETLPDLLLLDWMLPGTSGIELCRRIRQRKATRELPIIMLTARGEEAERVRGLATGADDYIVKPFSVPELIARVKTILRRSHPARFSDMIAVGDLQLDRIKMRATRNNRKLRLGPKEFRLLEFFMNAPEQIFSRDQLLDGVWGNEAIVGTRTVDVHVGRLRAAISHGKESDPIRTVRGVGYGMVN